MPAICEDTGKITVIGSDGKKVLVPRSFIAASLKFYTIVEEIKEHPEDYEEGYPLPDIESPFMEKILAWCAFHSYTRLNYEEMVDKERSAEWDQKFVDVNHYTLFSLLKAVGFFEIEPLENLVLKAARKTILTLKPAQLAIILEAKQPSTNQ